MIVYGLRQQAVSRNINWISTASRPRAKRVEHSNCTKTASQRTNHICVKSKPSEIQDTNQTRSATHSTPSEATSPTNSQTSIPDSRRRLDSTKRHQRLTPSLPKRVHVCNYWYGPWLSLSKKRYPQPLNVTCG